jgi:transcriptional regulator with XRE-family HTH domain
MFWEKFVSLCIEKGISPNGACAELGLSNATATKWKNGSIPRNNTLKKVADYFGVSVAYLTSVVDDPDPVALIDPSKKEPPMLERLNEVMRDMTEEELADLEKYVEFLLSKKNGGNS